MGYKKRTKAEMNKTNPLTWEVTKKRYSFWLCPRQKKILDRFLKNTGWGFQDFLQEFFRKMRWKGKFDIRDVEKKCASKMMFGSKKYNEMDWKDQRKLNLMFAEEFKDTF
jgi:hypothetical protein